MQTDIRILELTPYFTREKSRTPLKFGGVVMDSVLYCHVRATVVNRDGKEAQGWGAIFLSDVWAWPKCSAGHATAEQSMKDYVVQWCRQVEGFAEFAHPIEIFWQLEPHMTGIAERVCRERNVDGPMPRMAALVSASPVDAALHDAFGKAAGIDVYQGYGPEYLKYDLSRWLGSDFKGRTIADYLSPLAKEVDAFHLVGGLDKLSKSEIDADDPQDGLPVSLDQWIAHEGIHCLKVKLRGNDLDWDLQRMLAIAKIARQQHAKLGIEELWLTADTNEMCDTPQYMVELLHTLRESDPQAYDSLLYIEQPCERDLRRRRLDVRELAALKPVLVDEALSSLEDLQLALELGYSGAALKSCKCQSEELIIAAQLTQMGLPLAVQDLTNPGIALLHSVGLAGRIKTIRGVETNSRQFFPTTSTPEKKIHPGIYQLTNGKINTSTITGPGLGYRWDEIGRTFGGA
ncbi:MAG: enolase C-terminal domain-like protein [Pirellulales bacterium]